MFQTIYFVGHRGTGKSTVTGLVGELLDLDVVDLDEVIEAGEGMTCAEIIADSEPRFRRLEREYCAEVVARPADQPRIIALGGGYHPVPTDGVCIWLYRDGWAETAGAERARLRGDTDFSEEVAWMIDEREPRWEEGAHLRVDTSRGRGPERSAAEVATYIGWLLELGESAWAQRTWVVPSGAEQVERAARDAGLFGYAGVEVRSDLMSAEAAREIAVPVLASLRTDDAEWLVEMGDAAAFDVDILPLGAVLEAGALERLEPRPLLLSEHSADADSSHVDRLLAAAGRVAEVHPDWADHIVLKWAPTVGDYAELLEALDQYERLRDSGHAVTFLPQGVRFAWCRPPLLRENATNYVTVGLAPHRRSHTENPVQTPLDVQAWLPHLAGPAPQSFEGLVGDPVDGSQGDVWHRRAARQEGRDSSYLKIPFGREASTGDFARLLTALERMDVCGLSVTSPLKRTVLDCERVDNPEELGAANTLRSVGEGRWVATDTDEAGMRATLETAESRGFAPGAVAIIGRGGVSPAVLRAIEDSEWQLVHHASGRRGWGDDAPDEVCMVVNAAGDSDTAYAHPPACDVWVDLHYSGVRAAPESAKLHLNGDVFFDAQAVAQREYWYGPAGS